MKKKIVIVEDDYIIQELHKHYVENLGHQVAATFTSGEEAIEFFKDNSADLILMDIRLEDSIDGIETMKKIQAIRPIPVIYISGNTEEGNFKRAINTNMKGFLSKPLAPSELENIIDSINDLTDSILYAERIQKAIFPQREEIHRVFSNSIYINRPRDIISGDFSFLVPKKTKGEVLGGIGDCTGHGIPAALLSVLCHEILRSNSKKFSYLRKIITKLNHSIIRNLSRLDKENRVSDGLDMIMFRVIPAESRIEIAGIRRPFIHFKASTQSHDYHNLKGQTIGEPFQSEEDIPFISIQYEENDYFYFFSDGITDQFGGPRARKLMKSRLIEFLDSIASMTPLKREIELEIHLRKWQGNLNQTDDMLFLGICPSNINKKYLNN
jgi:CheY-like chemotaxis protein